MLEIKVGHEGHKGIIISVFLEQPVHTVLISFDFKFLKRLSGPSKDRRPSLCSYVVTITASGSMLAQTNTKPK